MIYVTGDTHGGIDVKKFVFKHFEPEDYVIILGDFGFVWEYEPKEIKEERKRLEAFLNMVGCTVLFVDGNHENFDRLNAFPVTKKFGGKVQKIADKCYHLMRGERYDINGFKFLALGGAESHDKKYRHYGTSIWAEESITEKEADKAIDVLKWGVDYVLTHCAPTSFQHKLFVSQNIPYNVYDENFSCQQLERVLHALEKQDKEWKWFMGHYHCDCDFKPFYVLYKQFYCIEKGKWV